MHHILTQLAHFFASLGGLGLLLLGMLDSSFLFLPLGNDLLLVLLTVQNPAHMPYYATMAAVGSLIGCFITESISRKGGEAGLEGRVSPRRLKYVQRQVTQRAGLMLGLAALMPPPFPFTLFVIVAAALKYPRARLLAIIGVARLARFFSGRFSRSALRPADPGAFERARGAGDCARDRADFGRRQRLVHLHLGAAQPESARARNSLTAFYGSRAERIL